MQSKASIKGHPMHPMLIAFPIAFLTGAFVCDLIGWLASDEGWWSFGAWLAAAGVVTALVAAIPGFVDYLYTVPPSSSAKKRATVHMVVNVSTVLLFIIAWILRGGTSGEVAGGRPVGFVILLELVGLGLLGVGGWLGGTLVYRNLIAVDHRYAGAGRWNEQQLEKRQGPLAVARSDELEVNQMKLLRVGEKRVVLARTAEGYVASDDRCTHRGGSLAGGVMMCGQVQCLWHGSQFDVRSGEVRSGPAASPIATYQVEERDGTIHLNL